MDEASADLIDRMNREDTLHVGAARPVSFLGLPMEVAVGLCAVGYFIQITITGLEGIAWAAVVVGPLWFFSVQIISQDPYGINVALGWYQTCFLCRDRKLWGGVSLSPLPADHRRKK